MKTINSRLVGQRPGYTNKKKNEEKLVKLQEMKGKEVRIEIKNSPRDYYTLTRKGRLEIEDGWIYLYDTNLKHNQYNLAHPLDKIGDVLKIELLNPTPQPLAPYSISDKVEAEFKHISDPDYQRIVTATATKTHVTVIFGNADKIKVPRKILDPANRKDLMWDDLKVGPGAVTVRSKRSSWSDSEMDLWIPWDELRVITDDTYGKYVSYRTYEQGKLIGARVKELRERRGIKIGTLSNRTGADPHIISSLEDGQMDGWSFSSIRALLAAIGYTLKDLAS